MTKAELEKEAIAKYKTGSYPQLHPDIHAFIHGYLAGAEPREKRIEELEKENKELKTVKIPQLERKIASIRGAHSVDCKKLNAKIDQCERQKELIKNLNKDIQNKDLALEDYTKWSESQKKKYDEQLAKAKEIIRKYYKYNPSCEYFYKDIDKEAEQFLKEASE